MTDTGIAILQIFMARNARMNLSFKGRSYWHISSKALLPSPTRNHATDAFASLSVLRTASAISKAFCVTSISVKGERRAIFSMTTR